MANSTQTLINEATESLAGGNYYTTGPNTPTPPEIIISHGKGAYVYTTDDERLLDFRLGHGSALLGHCPPTVSSAVKAQIDRGVNFAHISESAIKLASLMTKIIPCAEKVRLCNSGTEAVLLALRLVRAFTGKDKVLKFEGAYHGFADPLLFNTNYGNPDLWADPPQSTPDSPGIPASECDLVLVTPYNDIDQASKIIRENSNELAGIFIEPVMRGLASSPGFLEDMRQLASEHNIPLVFDEVITGFRLSLGGAQSFYGVTPDLAVYGKGLGAGYPIGAVAGSNELMSPLDPATRDNLYIFSLGGYHSNPLSATAAVATITELEKPRVYENLKSYGTHLRQELSELFGRSGLTTQMTGVGSIVEFFFTEDPITDYRSTLRSNLHLKDLLGQVLPRHGVFGGGGRYALSTCHRDDELSALLDALDSSLQDIELGRGTE